MRCAIVLLAAMGIGAQAQTFTTLWSFGGADGEGPGYGSLIQGLDGDFYGTTSSGGSSNAGTIFVISAEGQFKSLLSFNPSVSEIPWSGLVLAPSGIFYGTTSQGGTAGGEGTVFQFSPSGALTTLFSFSESDGQYPTAGVVQAFNGSLCGATSEMIYEIVPGGPLTPLQTFPPFSFSAHAAPIQGSNGTLYGTTVGGGAYGSGTVYSISLSGEFTTLYSFDGSASAGSEPYGALVEATNGDFYGTTTLGGNPGYGTVFQITPGGALTTVNNFNETDDRAYGALIQATDGNFYGTTGGPPGAGTIFQMTPTGVVTILHKFDYTDGALPYAGLVQGTDGNLYGTTYSGGAYHDGTVFQLSMGLPPFVRPVPWFGKVGAAVTILGTDLMGATSVTFNGVAAKFTVVSATAITATVPAGASTGSVQVVTPGGTLLSNVPFPVI